MSNPNPNDDRIRAEIRRLQEQKAREEWAESCISSVASQETIDAYEAKIAELEAKIQELKAQLGE